MDVSKDELTQLIRIIVGESDLEIITEKDVRRRVINDLGSRLGEDQKEIKRAVRDSLNVVMDEVSALEEEPDKADRKIGDISAKNVREINTIKDPLKKEQENFLNDADSHPAENSIPSKDDLPDSADLSDKKSPRPSRKRKRDNRSTQAKKSEIQSDSPEEDGDSDFHAENGQLSEDDEKPKAKTQRKRTRAAPKRKRTSSAQQGTDSVQKEVSYYLKVARSIACPVPIGRLRNKSVAEKRETIIEYLKEKGFNILDPSMLTQSRISKFREKIEREKELAELDTSNIINEEGHGRLRRRRSSANAKPSYVSPLDANDELFDSEEDKAPSAQNDPDSEPESEGYVGLSDSADD